jgi:hypothetical protein
MHGFLPKALIILTLWSGTGLALTGLQLSEAMERDNRSCLSGEGTLTAAQPCAPSAAAVIGAPGAG